MGVAVAKLDIDYVLPSNVIPVPLADEAGIAAAAQQALARFPEPVSRDDATFEEGVFRQLAALARDGMVDEFFVVVPEPPTLGAIAYIIVRYHVGEDQQFIEELLAEDTGGTRFVLEPPDASQRTTPLGTATRHLLRYTTGYRPKKRFGRKSDAPIVEQLSWYWAVTAPDGTPVVINLTAFVHDLAVSLDTRPIVDSFAEAIEFA